MHYLMMLAFPYKLQSYDQFAFNLKGKSLLIVIWKSYPFCCPILPCVSFFEQTLIYTTRGYRHPNIYNSFFWNYGFPKKMFSLTPINLQYFISLCFPLQKPLPEGFFSKVFMNLVKWFRRKKGKWKILRKDRRLLLSVVLAIFSTQAQLKKPINN